jgi:hypothetical protein
MPPGPLPGKFNLSVGAIVSDQTGLGAQITADLKTKRAGTFSVKGTADSYQKGGYLLWSIDL